MQSYQHQILKRVLNTLSLPMYLALPPIDHLRALLESLTLVSTLPWDVHFKILEHKSFKSDWLMPSKIKPNRVILYLHGGGYVIGSPRTHRGLAGKIAKSLEAYCLLPDYRKAPEFPFPFALNDAYDAYLYLLENGYNASEITIIGDSAGGGLTMALMLKLKDLELPLPRAAVLLSPYVDLVNVSESREYNAMNDRFLDIFEMRRWADLYVRGNDLRHPYVSPIYGDLSELPPLLIQASESEVLYDDAVGLHKKALQQGVQAELQTWKGLVHWWHMFGGLPEAKDAIQRLVEFLRQQYQKDAGYRKAS